VLIIKHIYNIFCVTNDDTSVLLSNLQTFFVQKTLFKKSSNLGGKRTVNNTKKTFGLNILANNLSGGFTTHRFVGQNCYQIGRR